MMGERPHYRLEAMLRYPEAGAEDYLEDAIKSLLEGAGIVVEAWSVFRTYPTSDYAS